MAGSAIAKPKLRGLLQASIMRNLTVAIALSFVTGFSYKFLVADPRKKRYAEFYKNYDPEKEFQRMKAAGVFKSC